MASDSKNSSTLSGLIRWLRDFWKRDSTSNKPKPDPGWPDFSDGSMIIGRWLEHEGNDQVIYLVLRKSGQYSKLYGRFCHDEFYQFWEVDSSLTSIYDTKEIAMMEITHEHEWVKNGRCTWTTPESNQSSLDHRSI